MIDVSWCNQDKSRDQSTQAKKFLFEVFKDRNNNFLQIKIIKKWWRGFGGISTYQAHWRLKSN